jgi:REP element-mobilizing transposase RayT
VFIAAPVGMPRRPRIDFPGAFHHVYARGIEKRDIFADRYDREELRRRISRNLKRFNAGCLAWAFMPNHFHLLFHSKSGNLPGFMRCLMSGYSIYFNKKHKRSGHLFQNRYKSSAIDTGRYLLELIRYIHLNPVRSGIVPSLEKLSSYRWTGHFEILAFGRLPWEQYPFVREFFSSLYIPGKEIYLAFLEEGLRCRSEEFTFDGAAGASKERLGLHETPPDGNRNGSYRIFLDIVNNVSRGHSISIDRILDGRRDRISSCARREILRQCVFEKGMTNRWVCKWLGITTSGGLYHLNAADQSGAIGSISDGD